MDIVLTPGVGWNEVTSSREGSPWASSERSGRDRYVSYDYDHLVQVKRAYDPGNLFHINQNIAP
jgi:hypothetical protein